MNRFGNVQVGMTRDEVRAVLGDPDDTGRTSRRQRVPLVWKYGEVELHFNEDGALWLIYREEQPEE